MITFSDPFRPGFDDGRDQAAKAAKYEGVGLAPFMAGLGVESTVVDAVSGAGDSALNGAEIVTDKKPCAPTPPKPSACSQNCPQ
jgi:hypothetical protein